MQKKAKQKFSNFKCEKKKIENNISKKAKMKKRIQINFGFYV